MEGGRGGEVFHHYAVLQHRDLLLQSLQQPPQGLLLLSQSPEIS